MAAHSHPLAQALPRSARDLAWFAGVAAAAFAIPYLGVTVLDLTHDVYYLGYFVAVVALIGTYIRAERVDALGLFRVRLGWSLAIGAVLAVFLVVNVVRTEGATPHPHGAYFVFEILLRGVGYGLVDVLLLTIFPALIAHHLVHGRVAGWRGKVRFAAVALPLVVIITATYHLGYPQYRADGVGRPETGNVLISIPTLVTVNPAGSVVAHVSQHVAAVTHAYESRIFNPPVTTVK